MFESLSTSHLTRFRISLATLGMLVALWGCEDTAFDTVDAGDAADGDGLDAADDAADDVAEADGSDDADADVSSMRYRPETVSNTRFAFSEEVEGLFESPWPDDRRLTNEGLVDLSGFPRRVAVDLIDQYASAIEAGTDGFSVMPVIYMPVDGTFDTSVLPEASESALSDSPLRLRQIAPDCGAPVPIEVRFEASGTAYVPFTTLQVVPAIGHPLQPGATYALVADGDWRGSDGLPMYGPEAFFDALRNPDTTASSRVRDGLVALDACEHEAIKARSLRMATTFTVQDPRATVLEMRERALLEENVSRANVRELQSMPGHPSTSGWHGYRGQYDTPIFMRGESPYATGGGVEFDDDGPIIQRFEQVPFTIALPDGATGDVPVILWVGGTGASVRGYLNDDWFQNAIDDGYAVATYAAQFHDTRATEGSSEEFSTFNYVNPEAGRTVFRQQAVDTSFFASLLEEAIPDALAALDEPVTIDATKLVYGGHSQGGLVGVLSASIEPRFASAVLSGTGAYTSITVLERKDLFDIEQIVRSLFGITEPLDRMHPIVQLVQLGADAVDPHSYMHALKGSDEDPDGVSVFLINGDEDPTTFVDSIDHINIAMGMVPIAPAGWVPARLPGDETPAQAPPISQTATAQDGTPITLATWLEGGGGHFTLFYRDDVARLTVDFWNASLAGTAAIPTFERDPE